MAVRVLIADEFTVAPQGLQTFLESDPDLQIVAIATSGKETIELTRQLKPHIVLLDLLMSEMTGFEALSAIRKEMPNVLVLIFTDSLEAELVGAALRAGANGFLLKNTEVATLCHILKTASPHQIILSPAAAQSLVCARRISTNSSLTKIQNQKLDQKLTEREHEVLQMMAQGLTNKEIANQLSLSEKTVKVHVSIILAKLGMQSRTQAALHAARLGLITYD